MNSARQYTQQREKSSPKLVELIERELEQQLSTIKPLGKAIDLLEVFCSANSSLTEQVSKLGGTAFRFGFDQGVLQTSEGRRVLFSMPG